MAEYGMPEQAGSQIGSAVPQQQEPQDIFIAFEGGGARGFAHVGALRALETVIQDLDKNKIDVNVAGVAGTSAGAIVATLYAAGFSADDLIDPLQKTNLFKHPLVKDLGFNNATDLLGKKNWKLIKNFRSNFKIPAFPLLTLLGATIFSVVLASTFLMTWWVLGIAIAAALVLVAVFVAVTICRATYGYASLDHARQAMDDILRRKLGRGHGDDSVKFRDFGGSTGRPSLKIVAADITHQKMHLFSPETTPSVAVADAVAASICLPMIFKPWKMAGSDSYFLDGGLVSNLPAWSFDEERLLNPSALTLAFRIKDSPLGRQSVERTCLTKWVFWLWQPHAWLLTLTFGKQAHWLFPAIRTALYGGDHLNKRAVGAIETVALDVGLKLLDFDASATKIYAEVDDATRYAEHRLRVALIDLPLLMTNIAEAVHQLAQQMAAPLNGRVPEAQGQAEPRVRVAFYIQEQGAARSSQARYAAGYLKTDPDGNLPVPLDGSHVGSALAKGCAFFTNGKQAAGASANGRASNRLELKRMRSLMWADMRWSLCLPFDHSVLPSRWQSVVVVIDGSHDLSTLPQSDIDLMICPLVESFSQALLPGLKQLHGSTAPCRDHGAASIMHAVPSVPGIAHSAPLDAASAAALRKKAIEIRMQSVEIARWFASEAERVAKTLGHSKVT